MTLTEKDFEKFKKYFLYWIKIFSLEGWEYQFQFDKETLVPENDAEIYVDLISKTVQVTLYERIQRNDIHLLAFHEACEVLLSNLTVLACERFISEDEIIQATHGIVRRLEHVIYKKHRDRKK